MASATLYLILEYTPKHSPWQAALTSGLFGGLGAFLAGRINDQRLRREIRLELCRQGYPVCLNCGYDLRGTTDRCPECGMATNFNQRPDSSDSIESNKANNV